ncbi:MAG TPA: 6-carboxytetrahydropterin synthase QueD [Candidatus Cloacimonadota bacterium]|nr:6-carboxytetrahydropterin synthase QueD [Candidatus Cloacimonadota bacterium]HPS39698.1 6-carboxytetrahydropterin synthase QueD [Candidatus Cloacimonadota bacterium]
MYKLNVTDTFSAAHRLCGYDGACSQLHGHNWKVRVGIACSCLDEIGMALDYGIIKKALQSILEELDHKYLNELEVLGGLNPTSENLARYIFEEMSLVISQPTCRIAEVEIYESERSSVVYTHD